ncbi:hypothetical protein Sjap_012184 [Stephania japonica]|uniref:Uncharacterized protein n=1 Tax=Stephania japonica TaxID=461633 RepID=A0AAP0IXG6_9MAGN
MRRAGPICIMCSLVVLQAIYRSIVARDIEFCVGVSDYGWSMWIIVITQIVTIIIGALVIAFRWLVLFHYFSRDFLLYEALKVMHYVMEDCPCASQTPRPRGIKSKLVSLRMKVMGCMKLLYRLVVVVLEIFICLPMLAMNFIVSKIPSVRCCMHRAKKDIMSSFPWVEQYYSDEMRSGDELVRRVMMVCLNNMSEWMNAVKRDPSPCHHTIDMLSRLDPSTTPQQLLERFRPYYDVKNIACLSMVVLVRVVAASVPDQSIPIIKSMRDTLDEAFEIVYFVDQKMNVDDIRRQYSTERQSARRLWKYQDFDMSIKVLSEDPNDPNDPVGCAISKINRADEILFADDWDAEIESRRVRDFIREGTYATIEDLCGEVQQLFSAMLHHLYAQLPICVYREIRECSVLYDCDERARHLTKLLLSNLDPILVDKVQWKFPDGWPANTSRNFDVPPDYHDTNAQLDESTEGVGSTPCEIGFSAGEIRLANASDNNRLVGEGVRLRETLAEKNFDLAFQLIYEFALPAYYSHGIYASIRAFFYTYLCLCNLQLNLSFSKCSYLSLELRSLLERKKGGQLTEFLRNNKGTIDDDDWDQNKRAPRLFSVRAMKKMRGRDEEERAEGDEEKESAEGDEEEDDQRVVKKKMRGQRR